MSRHHHRLNQRRWEATRRRVLARDNYRCLECGRAGRLEVDHRIPLWKNPDQDPYDIDGCQTLCRGCHLEKTRGEHRRPLTEAEQEWADYVAELADSLPIDAAAHLAVVDEGIG